MIISDRIEIAGASLQKPDKTKGKAADEKQEILSKDQITVSESAKEMGRLQLEVSKVPEIRDDRVNEVKNAINAGTYNVKGKAAAGKLLREAIIDSTV